MAVAALSTENNKWCRGKVIRLPGNRNVEVFFVDTGYKEIVYWTDLRMLQHEFFRLSKQVTYIQSYLQKFYITVKKAFCIKIELLHMY